jgi:hypothetical protein
MLGFASAMQEWCTMKMMEFQGSSEERARGYWGVVIGVPMKKRLLHFFLRVNLCSFAVPSSF